MAGLDEKVVRVYEIIFNNLMRLGLTVVGSYAFIKVLNALIDAKTPLDKGTYAFIEVLIAGTTFWPYRYFFFNKDAQKEELKPAPAAVPLATTLPPAGLPSPPLSHAELPPAQEGSNK